MAMRNPNSHDLADAAAGARGTLALLTLAYVLSYVDRSILALLVGPIRADLHLSDTEFSLLGGLAFALFYTILGVPLGWWADRGNRPRLISAGIGLWSVMTMLCGLAQSFPALFAARVGVGVGEAALSPAAYSLIADRWPPAMLARALAVYGAGVYVGTGLSFAGGGWLVDRLSAMPPLMLPAVGQVSAWQQVFLLVGAPGLVVAPLTLLLIRESRRFAAVRERGPAILPWIREHRRFLLFHMAGFGMVTLMFNGYLAWTTEYLLRHFAMSKAIGGFWLGIVVLVCGTGGMLFGGWLADALRARGDPRSAMTAATWAVLSMLPFPLLAATAESPTVALSLLAPVVLCSAASFGPAIAALQLAAPPPFRARIGALYLFVINLSGIGLGGTAVAILSDSVLGGGGTRLGAAMAIVGTVALCIAIPMLWLARRAMPAEATMAAHA